jgi:hypothetical protein
MTTTTKRDQLVADLAASRARIVDSELVIGTMLIAISSMLDEGVIRLDDVRSMERDARDYLAKATTFPLTHANTRSWWSVDAVVTSDLAYALVADPHDPAMRLRREQLQDGRIPAPTNPHLLIADCRNCGMQRQEPGY